MKIAIRVDAEAELGSGHVVRMLALAGALARRGGDVWFVARRMPPHLADAIEEQGHELIIIADGNDWQLPVSAWPEAAQRRDAEASCAAFGDADWRVVDHYGLDRIWERAVGGRILAVDDLGRDHAVTVLLDQNYYADLGARYWPGAACISLLGPRYALLRPDFAAARLNLAERAEPVSRMLLFMGGMNDGGATLRALDAIEFAELGTVPLDIVVGATHADQAIIENRVSTNPMWTLHVQASNMAALMADADLGIGAGGTATWERCSLGLPTVAVELADNQRVLLAEGGAAGLFRPLDHAATVPDLAMAIRNLFDDTAARHAMTSACLALVDARGTDRVADFLTLDIRRATAGDCDRLHAWRNHPRIRSVSHQAGEITLESHRVWFARALADPDRLLYVGEQGRTPVGVVRFDRSGSDAEVSIYLAPDRIGTGIGPVLLFCGELALRAAWPDLKGVTASVRPGNAASERLFERCGYVPAPGGYWKRIGV